MTTLNVSTAGIRIGGRILDAQHQRLARVELARRFDPRRRPAGGSSDAAVLRARRPSTASQRDRSATPARRDGESRQVPSDSGQWRGWPARGRPDWTTGARSAGGIPFDGGRIADGPRARRAAACAAAVRRPGRQGERDRPENSGISPIVADSAAAHASGARRLGPGLVHRHAEHDGPRHTRGDVRQAAETVPAA